MVNVEDVIDVMGELLIFLLQTIHLRSEFENFLVDDVGASRDMLLGSIYLFVLVHASSGVREWRIVAILFNVGLAPRLILGLTKWLLYRFEVHFARGILVVGVRGGNADDSC